MKNNHHPSIQQCTSSHWMSDTGGICNKWLESDPATTTWSRLVPLRLPPTGTSKITKGASTRQRSQKIVRTVLQGAGNRFPPHKYLYAYAVLADVHGTC